MSLSYASASLPEVRYSSSSFPSLRVIRIELELLRSSAVAVELSLYKILQLPLFILLLSPSLPDLKDKRNKTFSPTFSRTYKELSVGTPSNGGKGPKYKNVAHIKYADNCPRYQTVNDGGHSRASYDCDELRTNLPYMCERMLLRITR